MIEAIANLEQHFVSRCRIFIPFIKKKLTPFTTDKIWEHIQIWLSQQLHVKHDQNWFLDSRARNWYSHKFKKVCSPLLSIFGGISEPYQAGLNNDLEIFCASLATFLDPIERVEADDRYVCEVPLKVKHPASATVERERLKMMNHVQTRQVTINKRFKQWGILQKVHRHELTPQRDDFAALCVTQLAIENGKPFFEVEYDDVKITWIYY